MPSLPVVFSSPTGPTYSLKPLRQLVLRGRELRETRDGPVLATDSKYRWVTEGGTFSRFDCEVRCHVVLERDKDKASQRYGPFRGFSSLDGLKFVDHQMFCIYDETFNDWYGYESGEHWDDLIVIPTD